MTVRRNSLEKPPALAAVALLCACNATSGPASSPGLPVVDTQHKIQHVVIIVQENRSLNNLFYGFPGARTVRYGYNRSNEKIALQPVTLATKWDLQHNAAAFLAACNGAGQIPGTDCRMNGFDSEKSYCGGGGEPRCPNKNPPYSYVPHKETRPYFDMARQYVLADEMYASNFDTSSFISHQYIIAGLNPESAYDYPEGDWGCPGGGADTIAVLGPQRVPHGKTRPCWDPTTLGDELDAAGLPWAFYAVAVKGAAKPCGNGIRQEGGIRGQGIWSAYQAIAHICYGDDWSNDVFSPPAQFLTDVSSGNLRSVSWVTPTYLDSDHGGSGSSTGPSWVASLVNAIGESQYWNSTAIFVFWDDYGGWYDPQAPAYADNDGLGLRLPLLIISPYAIMGRVSHVHYEHGSILKFVEDQFGLARLAASDERANSPERDCFDFSQPPRKFVPIQAPYGESYFTHQPADGRPPDSD